MGGTGRGPTVKDLQVVYRLFTFLLMDTPEDSLRSPEMILIVHFGGGSLSRLFFLDIIRVL